MSELDTDFLQLTIFRMGFAEQHQVSVFASGIL